MAKEPTARELERALGAELLAELRASTQRMTEFAELLAGQAVNHTLEVWSGVFPADGIISRDYSVAAGAIRVRNRSAANTVTVSSAGPQSSTPTGLGTAVVPIGAVETVPLASRQVTLYGTAGEAVSLQVFTSAVRPVTG